ncbi:MAG: IS5 family transposase [Acetobacteraceae bacterium]|nr:IS5 family transposase [Acetobacteraceae bacterium]
MARVITNSEKDFGMERGCLTDEQWSKMQPFCLGKPTDPGRTGGDTRLFMEAVLWVARTGRPWRDLPPSFGKWHSVYRRFRSWVRADVFKRMFEAVAADPDMEYTMVDDMIIKVDRDGQGAKRGLRARRSAPPRGAGGRESC